MKKVDFKSYAHENNDRIKQLQLGVNDFGNIMKCENFLKTRIYKS